MNSFDNHRWAGLVVLSALLLLLGVSSPSCTTQPVAPSQQLKIVTTSNIVADWVGRVGRFNL